MFLRLLLLTFSTLSHAQTYNSLIWDADSQAYNSKDIARYEGERGWAKLKESYKVTLNKGVNIYSQPEFAGNPSLTSWWPREATLFGSDGTSYGEASERASDFCGSGSRGCAEHLRGQL
jgi:hypothetical protein